MARRSHIDPRRAIVRVAVSALVGVILYALTHGRVPFPASALVAWDAASLTLLGLSWALIHGYDARATRDRAGSEDPGRTLVYVIVVVTSAASMLAASTLVRDKTALGPSLAPAVAFLCLATVAIAWTMTHTAFTFRYAHLYYREDREGIGGVEMPGKAPPTYFDFAYFAFTIGMCFQVSDVCVTSSQIRRAVLLHAVISFAYNSILLAFVLNLVFGLAS
ncbi:MAG TPA: DUF1345 domain-containing protein [Polyangiaceae bacterium]